MAGWSLNCVEPCKLTSFSCTISVLMRNHGAIKPVTPLPHVLYVQNIEPRWTIETTALRPNKTLKSYFCGFFLHSFYLSPHQVMTTTKTRLFSHEKGHPFTSATRRQFAPYWAAMASGLQNAMCTMHFGAVVAWNTRGLGFSTKQCLTFSMFFRCFMFVVRCSSRGCCDLTKSGANDPRDRLHHRHRLDGRARGDSAGASPLSSPGLRPWAGRRGGCGWVWVGFRNGSFSLEVLCRSLGPQTIL